MRKKINIVWFKRDLRIHDHRPLHMASQQDLPVLPLYIIEPEYWAEPFASRRHWHFIHDCLMELKDDLSNLGQRLVFKIGEAVDVFQYIHENFEIANIYAHEETGNGWTYKRDKAVINWCKGSGIELNEHPSNGVVRRLKNRDGWSRIRNTRMAETLVPKPEKLRPLKDVLEDDLPSKDDPIFGNAVPGITQKGGRRAAIQMLTSFLNSRGKEYIYRLSAPGPSEKYCSRISPHLTWGTLSVREVVQSNTNRRNILSENEKKVWKRNLSAFGSRLSWRCHFIQKIEDQPEIEFKSMHPAFEGMREHEHNEKYYQAWKKGRTGYPFIDACMRSLVYEGWITFRMRAMLVSFASYHLWLDWRKTGYHLAQLFTDYEPGIHYSQLQMQSGVTGINALRIYNPAKQSQEHDPKGEFIREWVSELKDVPDMWIHEPWKMDESLQEKSHCMIGKDYPFPIVDHSAATQSARRKISIVRKSEGFKDQSGEVYRKLGSRKRPSSKNRKSGAQKQLALPL